MLLRPFINHLTNHISIMINYLSLSDIFWTIQHSTLTSSQWKKLHRDIISHRKRISAKGYQK